HPVLVPVRSVRSARLRRHPEGHVLQAQPRDPGRGLRALSSRRQPGDRRDPRRDQGTAASVAAVLEGPRLRPALFAGAAFLGPRDVARPVPQRAGASEGVCVTPRPPTSPIAACRESGTSPTAFTCATSTAGATRLAAVLVPYFAAGLRNQERCI